MIKYVEEHSDDIAHHAGHPAYDAVLAYLKEKRSPAPVPPTLTNDAVVENLKVPLTLSKDDLKIDEVIRQIREDPQFLEHQHKTRIPKPR